MSPAAVLGSDRTVTSSLPVYELQPPLCCPVLIPNSFKPETFSFPHRDFDQFSIAFLLIFTLAPFCYHLKTLTVTAHVILKKPVFPFTPSELFLKTFKHPKTQGESHHSCALKWAPIGLHNPLTCYFREEFIESQSPVVVFLLLTFG